MDPKLIGIAVRRKREALHLTQEQLAVKAKIGSATVRNVEHGVSSTLTTLNAICGILGTSLEHLMVQARNCRT